MKRKSLEENLSVLESWVWSSYRGYVSAHMQYLHIDSSRRLYLYIFLDKTPIVC